MATNRPPADDRARLHRGSPTVTARLTRRDRDRLDQLLDASGRDASGYVRSLILRDLDAMTST